jgi:ComF family protein
VLLARVLSVFAPPLCAGCGACAGRIEPLCGRCRAELRWLAPEPVLLPHAGLELWAPFFYAGPARALVRALKFRGSLPVAAAMAAQMAANAPPGLLAGGALVPVPLHPARRRARGFNQAERIAAELGARCGLAVEDCLERLGRPATQMGRTRNARLAGIEGEVALRSDVRAPPSALIVDDVVTTGATLAACARALRGAGAASIAAVAYARTPGR